MDIKQLDYFVHVAELGSFTKASALLSVAQSALSHQVRQLEVELKQVPHPGKLFFRMPISFSVFTQPYVDTTRLPS